jgi:digeranylgeranylglycerophospholipid reductase
MPGELSTDNFMAIGDTVPTIDPLWGEGIHKGMQSGRAAATTADRCLTPEKPDTSAKGTAIYNKLWHSEVAPRMRERLLMTELLYLAPNSRYDKLMKDLAEADENTLAKANAGNLKAMLKLVRARDIPLLARFARERLSE